MNPGQRDVRRHRTNGDRFVPDPGNVVVGWPVVRHQAGFGGHCVQHERVQFVLAEAVDHLQPGAPRCAAVDFDRAGDQHLADATAARRHDHRVVLGAERNDRFICLDDAAQRLTRRVDHGQAQGKRFGRPPVKQGVAAAVRRSLDAGVSVRKTAALHRIGIGTVQRIKTQVSG